jgi:hypothetical protein
VSSLFRYLLPSSPLLKNHATNIMLSHNLWQAGSRPSFAS